MTELERKGKRSILAQRRTKWNLPEIFYSEATKTRDGGRELQNEIWNFSCNPEVFPLPQTTSHGSLRETSILQSHDQKRIRKTVSKAKARGLAKK